MKTLGSQIKEARQRRHLSQSALARLVGCKQSALSMYESGRTSALSAIIVGNLCKELGILPPTAAELAAEANFPVKTERTFCPNHDCPSNLPLTIGERTVLVPHEHHAGPDALHCPWCGEVLERACPECGAPLNEGAFCSHCGSAYLAPVSTPLDPSRAATSERIFAWSK